MVRPVDSTHSVDGRTRDSEDAVGCGLPEIDEVQPTDTVGDGLSTDFTTSGETVTDVTVFFECVNEPVVVDYLGYRDFGDNG